MWTLTPLAAVQAEARRQEEIHAVVLVRGKPESQALTYLRDHPGWHNYAEIADRCGLSYASVAQSIMRNKSCLNFANDSARRVLVMWKGDAVVA